MAKTAKYLEVQERHIYNPEFDGCHRSNRLVAGPRVFEPAANPYPITRTRYSDL